MTLRVCCLFFLLLINDALSQSSFYAFSILLFPFKNLQGMYEYASELGLIQEGMLIQDGTHGEDCPLLFF